MTGTDTLQALTEMPTLPLPKCKVALCMDRVHKRQSSYCLKHQREMYTQEQERTYDPFYSKKAWKVVRLKQLRDQPWCARCLLTDKLTKANTVDHIIPRQSGGSDYSADNLQSLCFHCHQMKRSKERGYK